MCKTSLKKTNQNRKGFGGVIVPEFLSENLIQVQAEYGLHSRDSAGCLCIAPVSELLRTRPFAPGARLPDEKICGIFV